jgi:non-specific serine/threonine protein kinase/serine/threonine-protein kinase
MKMGTDSDDPPQVVHPATPESGNEALLTIEADATLAIPTPDHAASSAEGDSAPARLKSIGRYQLLRKIGEGGMGQVWLAEQTAPVRRQVALKLIKAGIYDDSVVKRFQSERQALAIMDHPAIAKVFDAGTTPEGQPYFVMEYVPGEPITRYCDQKKLTIRQRLELFLKVCDGVQHAHQKAVIHRDLKPANILVVEVDGQPQPRIIDFGLAKAVSPQPAGETLFTQVGGVIGTPGYMSPEQTDPGVQDVDTRTDVYSLGVVLYELLTGCALFDPKQWQKQPWHEVLRQLREDDPPRPSTRVGQEKATATAQAQMRGTEPRHLVSLLRGDLDWITMKAVERDRARRYGTPSEVAADLGRYLRNEPVTARPASTGYHLRKYVRRHRVGVAVAAGLVLLLAGFAVMESVEIRRVTRERDRANRITQFMTDMFRAPEPGGVKSHQDVTAREILDRASKQIETGLANDPELQGQLMYTMGDVYTNLNLYATAKSMLERSVEIRRRALGPDAPETMQSLGALGWLLQQGGEDREAEKLLRESLDGRRRVLGPEHRDTLHSMFRLASVLSSEGHYAEAEKLFRQTLDGQRRVLGPDHDNTLETMDGLAGTLAEEGRIGEAEALQRTALDIRRRVRGPDDAGTVGAMGRLGMTLEAEGRLPEAEKLLREALDGRRRILGPEHPFTLNFMEGLATVLVKEGDYEEAEKLERETIEIRSRVLGPESRETAIATYNLACLVLQRGQRQEALSLLRQAVDHGFPSRYALEIENDSDLKPLHGDPQFVALMAHARELAAQNAK